MRKEVKKSEKLKLSRYSSNSVYKQQYLKKRKKNSSSERFNVGKVYSCVEATATFFIVRSVPIKDKCNKIFADSTLMKNTSNCCKKAILPATRNITGKSNKLLSKNLKFATEYNIISHEHYKNYPICKRIHLLLAVLIILSSNSSHYVFTNAQVFDSNTASKSSSDSSSIISDSNSQSMTIAASCFGGLPTFEKISMSTFENPSSSSGSSSSFGSGILVQQDDQALTSECVNLCRSQSNCLSFVIDYNKFECKSYATTQQELQQEFDAKYQAARSVNSSTINATDQNGYQASASIANFQHLLPSASSNYFEKICLDGVANRNQFSDVCGHGRLWTIERVVDSFLDGYIEKELTNVNNKDECSKLCIFETQFVCRSADYDQHSRLCRLSKEDRRTQPQAMRYIFGSNRQYLENQCATLGPSSCVYETRKNVGIISMDALKFAQTVQDCQMKCNQESTFNCRSYSYHQQRCFLSGDDSSSLNSNLVKLPMKQGWLFGEKKCLVELCTKGIFSYEKITGYTLRSALSTPIDLMMPSSSSLSMAIVGNNLDDLERLQHESSQTRLRQLLPIYHTKTSNSTSNLVSTMMMIAANSNPIGTADPLQESASSSRHQRSVSNLAITNHCRHSCDLGYLNCPAFTIDYKNNRCQRLDRNSQGRHHELVARDGFSYYEKICLRVPEIMSMCQDKYWIFERVIGYELAPRLYDKSLKFVQSRRDCEEYCLEEKQFQCRSALYNDEISDCKLSRYDRRLASQEGGYYRNFNARVSYLENQCILDRSIEKKQQCFYEQSKEEASYPTFTEHIETVHSLPNPTLTTEIDQSINKQVLNKTMSSRYGSSYCEQLCNDNAKFECHSFGYYASTAQCFLSGDDSISAGDLATTLSTGFTYFEKKCKLAPNTGSTNYTMSEDPHRASIPTGATTATSDPQNVNPYFQPPHHHTNHIGSNMSSTIDINHTDPFVSNNTSTSHIDQQPNMGRPHRPGSQGDVTNEAAIAPDQYKCGHGHTFIYQRVSGFEPIGGYLTLLVKNNEQPGIVSECSELCKRAYECRAFVVDYNNNQCFAMLENSSVGFLSLRQTLGRDYFEGFCIPEHILISGSNCGNKTWLVDKIVDQAVIGVQHQKVIPDSDRAQCRQACLEERLFWCKSAMFDGSTGDCKLYSIERESTPQMRLLFTKDVDFYENQCQIVSSSCPYDAIERDMTITTVTKSAQARSTFDCEYACNSEITFNCRSYTFLDQYPSLPNLCLLSSDSRSTSQKGSVKERQRTLYAERNCYYRRPRYPSGSNQKLDSTYSQGQPVGQVEQDDPYQVPGGIRTHSGHSTSDNYSPSAPPDSGAHTISNTETSPALGQGCEPHQYTFERTFGYDFRLGQKERAPIAPTIGIAISCQQECLRRGDRCQSFVVDYALPYQSCFLIETQVGTNKKLLVKSPNSAYFEKLCLPRTGIDAEPITHGSLQMDLQSLDIAPSYSHEPWSPQIPNQLPYYLQQQQLVQNYPSRSCAKLWSFERFINHNFTATSDKILENIITRGHCETQCLNEASFNCRAATYDYSRKICSLFKNTRRTMMSQFIDLDLNTSGAVSTYAPINISLKPQSGTAHVISGEVESIQTAPSSLSNVVNREENIRQARLLSSSSTTSESSIGKNIDYLENTCTPEPSSCQYRQLYDLFSPYIDKINHAVSLSDCQRQCDLERLFSCKSINYDPSSKNCMLINEDLISLNRGQQASLMPKKNTIYSEKGNCEMISVQCNSQEMLVSINFDSPFRGRVMAKGNPEQCFLIGDGQTSVQFPIVFGPKCNSRQEGHNTFVNEVLIQQHPVIMTDSDKTVRVMCAFEAPEQTITLKNPSSRDNKTGIDVGTPESSRTRHDKQHFNSVISNKASPPSVLLRILDQNGRDASMINLGDDLVLRIQMQMDGQNSALGIFARNLAARSSNGESLLLIDNEGCPVDHQVFPALEVDPKDGKSLYSIFKAFRFPSSGLVNFEVQIRFCPERCQPVDCHKGQKMKSHGRRKRDISQDGSSLSVRIPVIQSVSSNQDSKNPVEVLSTVMKPGKAFQYVRELMLASQASSSNLESDLTTNASPVTVSKQDKEIIDPSTANLDDGEQSTSNLDGSLPPTSIELNDDFDNSNLKSELEQSNHESISSLRITDELVLNRDNSSQPDSSTETQNVPMNGESEYQSSFQKSILMHFDEKVVPSTGYINSRGLNQPHSLAPYGRFPLPEIELHNQHQNFLPISKVQPFDMDRTKIRDERITDQNRNFSVQESSQQDLSRVNSIASAQNHQNGSLELETVTPDGHISKLDDPSWIKDATTSEVNHMSSKDVPLRFSILVGENQTPSNGWIPGAPVLVMNSSNVDLDNIVIPGKNGQFEHRSTSNSRDQADTSSLSTTQNLFSTYNEANYQKFGETKSIAGNKNETNPKNTLYEQTFDALPSSSVAAEVKINQASVNQFDLIGNTIKNRQNESPSEIAASHDCQVKSGNSGLWTIIWTGAFVIGLNICLVVLSLVLYFKKVHLRKNHNIERAISECGTHSSNGGHRWPSVLLKSKNNLGTSLNTHEHFFCKLNSKPNGSDRVSGRGFNWPNLSSSSSHSTISSMASPLPVTSVMINQTRLHKPPFDTQSSLRDNFNVCHKSILDMNSYNSNNNNLHARYTNNIDESHPETFQVTR